MRFREWFESNRFLTEIFGRFNYQFPDNKSQQMADFYVLSMLLGRSSFDLARDKNLAKGDNIVSYGKSFSPTPKDFTEEDKIDHLLQEVAGILIPKLKKQLLKEVMFSISAEMRYVTRTNRPETLLHLTDEELGPEYANILRKFLGNIVKLSDERMKPFLNPARKKDTRGIGDYSGAEYMQSYQAALRTEAAPEKLAVLAKFLFSNPNIFWQRAYGGEAWANIANAWMQLYRAHNLKDIIIYIDHIYDIEHNTGSVFDKLASYRDENNRYGWIKSLLDRKAGMNSPLELYSKVSPAMKPLLARATKLKFGKTLEDEGLASAYPQGVNSVTPEIIKEYMDFYDNCNHLTSMHRGAVAATALKIIARYPNIPVFTLIKSVFPNYLPDQLHRTLEYYDFLLATQTQMTNENLNGWVGLTSKDFEAIRRGQLQQLYYKIDLRAIINHFNEHTLKDILDNLSANQFVGAQKQVELATGFQLMQAMSLTRALHIWAHCSGACRCVPIDLHQPLAKSTHTPMGVLPKSPSSVTGMGAKFDDPYASYDYD